MNDNIKNLQLKNFIHIEKGLVPKDTCRFVINSIKNQSWNKHSWFHNEEKYSYSYSTKELDILDCTQDLEDILNPLISISVK